MAGPALKRRRKRRADILAAPLPRRNKTRRKVFTTALPVATQTRYRRYADCWAESTDGVVYNVNGIDQPVRWDGFTATLQAAGIVGPGDTPSMSGGGSGQIVGEFYCYTRFYDAHGNFSNLSPASALLSSFANPATITVTDASLESPIVITTGEAHGLSTGQVVKVQDVSGNTAANGIWYALVLTATTFSISVDGANSTGNGSYLGGGTVATGFARINYSNVGTTTDPKVIGRQILRNKDGDTETFYVDIDTADLTSTAFSSTTTSEGLSGEVPLFDSSGNDLAVIRFAPPLSIKAVIISQLGRMFALVNTHYSEGCVSVISGSKTVTGIGTEWNYQTFSDRWIDIVGADKAYQIASVSGQTLTLKSVYAGVTDPYARYVIRPDLGERRSFYWSEAELPEAWPIGNQRTLAEDPGAGDMTGAFVLNSFLYLTAEYRLWVFSFQDDPGSDGFAKTRAARGLVNHRCSCILNDAAYLMDVQGVYQFSGNNIRSISDNIQDLFRNSPTSPYRMNWDAKRSFHCIQDPGTQVMRWFVCLSGATSPHHALCYHLVSQRWWIEEYRMPISSSCLGYIGNRPQVFLGTNGGRILALDGGLVDGPTSGTIHGTLTSSGRTWLADSTASFASSGLVGFPVRITQGKGKGQERTIYAVSGTKVYVTQPWTDQPDTTSTYQMGGFLWKWSSAFFEYQADVTESKRELKTAVAVQWTKTASDCCFDLRTFRDLSTTPETVAFTRAESDANGISGTAGSAYLKIDATKERGYAVRYIDRVRDLRADGPRFVQVELSGVPNADPLSVYKVVMDGVNQAEK